MSDISNLVRNMDQVTGTHETVTLQPQVDHSSILLWQGE